MDELLGVFLKMSAPLCVSDAYHIASPELLFWSYSISMSLSIAASEKEQCNISTSLIGGSMTARSQLLALQPCVQVVEPQRTSLKQGRHLS